MGGFPILDLVVGMMFIYFLLSIICSSAVEMAMTVFKIRGRILGKWLMRIFDQPVAQAGGKTLGQAIMDHCSITALSEEGMSPSYIDAKNFSAALIEKISFDPNNPKSITADLDTLITKIQNTNCLSIEIQRTLLSYAHEVKEKFAGVEEFKGKVEDWYNSSMERLTGELKRKYARPFTIIIALIATVLLNADSISIAKYLYSNPEARASLVAKAYEAVNNDSLKNKMNAYKYSVADSLLPDSSASKQDELLRAIDEKVKDIQMADASLKEVIPIGWNDSEWKNMKDPLNVFTKLLGFIVTMLAMVMGAPFWFDMLNKIANLRGSGPKPVVSQDDSPPASANNARAVQTAPPVNVSVNSNNGVEAVG